MAVTAPTERKGQRPVPECEPDRSLPRSEVLRRKADLERVNRRGCRVSGPALSLAAARSSVPGRRVAFLLVRGTRRAVDRNRIKRRLREVYRLNKHWFPAGFDYCIRAKSDAAGVSSAALASELRALAERLGYGR